MKTHEITDRALQALLGFSDEHVYAVQTYDLNGEKFTPQEGIPAVCARSELRTVIAELRRHGYDACKGDASVLIQRVDELSEVAKFLKRGDVAVGHGDGYQMVVHHQYWLFEGRARNVIDAAEKAMENERSMRRVPSITNQGAST